MGEFVPVTTPLYTHVPLSLHKLRPSSVWVESDHAEGQILSEWWVLIKMFTSK